MNRINFWLGVLTMVLVFVEPALQADERPNFVIIMADDLGFGDIGCYGNDRIKTPNIDRMAKQGIKFTDFHSSGTVCSPTRCGLMTGRYQQRAGIPAVVSVKHKHLGMSPSEVTFAEVFRNAGYETALFGKWHLGYQKKFNPIHQGFDKFHGYVSGNVDFFSHVDQSGAFDWWIGDQLKDEAGYTTHLITNHAVEFINQSKDKPFCLYLAHEAPHYPYQGPNDVAERSVGGKFQTQGKRKDIKKAYKEMVEEMDKGIGKVLAALEKNGLDKKTVVWFFSDNGANQHGDNGGLRGFKGSVWEGGHRVPSVAYWPGEFKKGSVTSQLAITLDVFPTIVALAGITSSKIPPLDGKDLSQTLISGDVRLPNRTLFWGSGNQRAMRTGRWKLVHKAKGQGKGPELFDLNSDRGETKNLASENPAKVKQMMTSIKNWDEEVGPSVFGK